MHTSCDMLQSLLEAQRLKLLSRVSAEAERVNPALDMAHSVLQEIRLDSLPQASGPTADDTSGTLADAPDLKTEPASMDV